MSFLYRTTPLIRVAARPSTRLFSTSIVQQKSATDTIKDGLNTVNKAVSDAAAKGIDKTQELKDRIVASTPDNASEAQGDASKLAGQAQGKASELAGQAQGKASELSGQAKGKAEELKGEAKSKMS